MNKIVPLILLSFAGCTGIHAQVRLAAFGGLHSANIMEKNNIPGWDTTTKKYYSSRTGFQMGVLAEIPLGNKGFYFQPGLVFNSKGRQYSKYNDSNTASQTDTIYSQSSLTVSYIELPLYFTYKIPLSANHRNNFFISGGPYFSFFYSGSLILQSRILSSNQYNSENDDLQVGNAAGKYKTFDMGFDARAGLELGSVMISGFFSRGISNLYTSSYTGTFHHQLFGATLGIWLTRSNSVKPILAKKDSDNDGVPDDEDMCPFLPGTIERHGCPAPDTDHDGIDDDHDSCKTVPGVARYHGCPVPDTDGDGIDDEHDSCRTVPGLARYNGCPIPDRDGDGVNDEEDKCPDQPGSKENNGCPIIPKEIPVKIKYESTSVKFKSSSNKLTNDSRQSLNDIASLMQGNPQLHLTISGYTDSTGRPAHNLSLSRQRAEVVKSYLVGKGIPADRITTIGYGQLRPVADNNTEEGKALNRRVEFNMEEKNK
ncbi:MAG TPA: OmpA family protein [Puia sp.]|nr:OmpA family protein [Puia sp.]